MKNLYFDDFEDLACDITDTYDSLDGEDFEDVAIIAKYEEARQIIKELLCLGYDIHSVEIHDDLWENYDAEYVISLYDNSIWCEPMLRENGYIEEYAPVIYVLDNCSSKVIPYCKGKNVYEVTVGDDECGCDECDECEEEGFTINGKPATKEEFDNYVSQFKHDEKPTTISSTTTYRVNGKEVDKDTYEKALNELDDKYLDNVQDMLLNYFDFVNEMNEWRKMLLW